MLLLSAAGHLSIAISLLNTVLPMKIKLEQDYNGSWYIIIPETKVAFSYEKPTREEVAKTVSDMIKFKMLSDKEWNEKFSTYYGEDKK